MNVLKIFFGILIAVTPLTIKPAARGGGKIAHFQQAKNKLVEALAKGDLKMLQQALKNQTVKNSLQDMLFNKDILLFGTQSGEGIRFQDAPPLYLACLIGFVEGIEELLSAGLTWTSRGKDYYSNFSPIHSLARSRWEGDRSQEQLQAEIEKLASIIPQHAVNDLDGKGFTPLMCACNDGNVQSTKVLLAAGAQLEMRNKKGKTALFLAISGDSKASPHGSVACVDLLLKAGADVNALGVEGVRPLGTAAVLGRVDSMRRLLQEPNIDVNGSDSTMGLSPLHLAILSKNSACVSLLLADPRVNLFARTVDGRMPISLAVEVGSEEIIDMLYEAVSQYASSIRILEEDSSDIDESEVEPSELVEGVVVSDVDDNQMPSSSSNHSVDTQMSDETKVLFDMIQAGDIQRVESLLLDVEIDPRISGPHGLTPLEFAQMFELTPAITEIKRLLNERIEFLTLLDIVKKN